MAFRVDVLETAQSFEVNEGESVLAAAMRSDVELAHECTLGGCGTCRVKLASGSVDYEEFPLALTPEEADEGYALACQARPTSDLVISVARDDDVPCQPARHAAIVRDIRAYCDDVIHLCLELPQAQSFDYRPGQYMNVFLEGGGHRSFSMASVPAGNRVDFHVRKVPGGRFTQSLLPGMRVGQSLEVELPLGAFRYHDEDYQPLLMVATGTGISPVKCILESLLDDPDCPPVSLYWGMRTEADLYLDSEIRSWANRLFEFRYVPVLSRPDASWQGRRGHVQDAVTDDFNDLSEQSIYLCGVPEMISQAKKAFIAKGASIDHIYIDGFSYQSPNPEGTRT